MFVRFLFPLMDDAPGAAGGGTLAAPVVVAPATATPAPAPAPAPKPRKDGEPREPSAFEKGLFKRLGLKVRDGESIDEAIERHKGKLSERKMLRQENTRLVAQTPLLQQYMEIALSTFSATERAAIEAIGKGDFQKTLDTIRMSKGGLLPATPATPPATPAPGVQPAAGTPAPAVVTQTLQSPRVVQPGLTTSAAPSVTPGTTAVPSPPETPTKAKYYELRAKNPWLASAYAAQHPQIFDRTG